MKFWTGSSIGVRMAWIAVLPVAFLFTAFIWYSWYAHRAQVDEELAERGRILAQALAQTSEYNLISGNLSDLRLTLNGLVASDRSIFRIAVVDAQRVPVIQAESKLADVAEERSFEAPVRKQTIWINLFSDNGTPHVSGSSDNKPPTLTTETVGYVLVTMSPSNMMARQTNRFYIELAIAALALAVANGLAWFLARSLAQPLKFAIGALRQIRGGNYLVQLPVTTGGEVGELQESISEMSVALHQAKQGLEDKVAERTRELSKLIQKVNSIIEAERQSIAVEIHDELNASLIAVRLEAQAIHTLGEEAGNAPAVAEIRAKAAAITKLSLDLYASGRRLVRRLRPEVLDMLGLHGALEEMIRHYDASHPDCDFRFSARGDFSALQGELPISAYRMVQEALSNVIKHAGASHVHVALAINDEERMLEIDIADDGVGFAPAVASEGIGIIGMRERAAALGGSVEWNARPGEGTTIAISLPLI